MLLGLLWAVFQSSSRPATEAVGTSKGYLQMAGKPIGRLPGKVVGASLEENNI